MKNLALSVFVVFFISGCYTTNQSSIFSPEDREILTQMRSNMNKSSVYEVRQSGSKVQESVTDVYTSPNSQTSVTIINNQTPPAYIINNQNYCHHRRCYNINGYPYEVGPIYPNYESGPNFNLNINVK